MSKRSRGRNKLKLEKKLTQGIKLKTIYWMMQELDKIQKPRIKEKEIKCQDNRCKGRAKVKITYKDQSFQHFCLQHANKVYTKRIKDVHKIDKAGGYKIEDAGSKT